MPRKQLIVTDEFPYHITNRSNNREFFYLPQSELWHIFLMVLDHLTKELEFEIHAFVLMTNHYHLLLRTPKSNLSQGMTYLHREVAKRANSKVGRVNHFWGARYKWSVIYDDTYYWNAVKYIFRNPIEAGLSKKVEDYKYSSLPSRGPSYPWQLPDLFESQNDSVNIDLNWLNESFEETQNKVIQKALRRREFKLPAGPDGKRVILEAPPPKKELGT